MVNLCKVRDYHTARKDTSLWMNAHFNETWGTQTRNILNIQMQGQVKKSTTIR